MRSPRIGRLNVEPRNRIFEPIPESGNCPFHGGECYHECGSDTARRERAARDPQRLERDRLKNNELAEKHPHLYTRRS